VDIKKRIELLREAVMLPDDALVGPATVAALHGRTEAALAMDRSRGVGLPWYVAEGREGGRGVRYRLGDARGHMKRVEPGSAARPARAA
jgi:hypothetical protein